MDPTEGVWKHYGEAKYSMKGETGELYSVDMVGIHCYQCTLAFCKYQICGFPSSRVSAKVATLLR